MALRGSTAFKLAPSFCRAQFSRDAWPGPLRAMSETLFGLGPMRQGDWQGMRGQMFEGLDPRGQDILMEAEANCVDFDRFFSYFARPGHIAHPQKREMHG